MESFSDERIIEGILHGDRKVLDYIYSRYYGKVERFLIGKGGDPDHIKDVFQDALIVLYQKVNGPGLVLSCSFSTYLFASALIRARSRSEVFSSLNSMAF